MVGGRRSDAALPLAWFAGILLFWVVVAVIASFRDGGDGDGVADQFPDPRGPRAALNYVTVESDARQVDAVLSVVFPAEWLASLRWEDNGDPLFSCDLGGSCQRIGNLGDAALKIELREGSRVLVQESVPLEQVSVGPVPVPASIPVVGTPSHFPQDSYRSEMLTVWFRDARGVRSDLEDLDLFLPQAHDGAWRLRFNLDDADGFGDYTANVERVMGRGFELGDRVVVARKSHVRILIYAVAAAPVLLMATAVNEWASLRHSGGSPQLFGFEVAAALLAILPLREVLVPDGLGGLTRLDYLLAGEVVLVIALVVFTAAIRSATSTARLPEAPAGPAVNEAGGTPVHDPIRVGRPAARPERQPQPSPVPWVLATIGFGVASAVIARARRARRRRYGRGD